MSWTVIVPVKRLDIAKSRLRGAVVGIEHDALVLAMAMDTVDAAQASPVVGRVVVVTSDPDAGAAALELGAEVIEDVPDAGLNPALAYAATMARPKGATASLPGVAALAADLPALRAEDLTAALRAVELHSARANGGHDAAPVRLFVTDAARTGTVMLAAPPGARLEPCFGSGSAAAHAASGAVALEGEWASLRRDVDTAADLAEAVVLGLGPRTADVMARTTTSRGATPRDTVPHETAPPRSTPRETAPAGIKARDTAPGETAPSETATPETVSSETVSAEAVSVEVVSVEVVSAEVVSAEVVSVEAAPPETAPRAKGKRKSGKHGKTPRPDPAGVTG